jgi:hypothetical protein
MRVTTTTQTPSKSTKEHRPKTREKMRKVQQTILLLFCQKSRKSEVPKILVGLLLENPKKSITTTRIK